MRAFLATGLFLLTLHGFGGPPALASEDAEQVDAVSLAALLIRDGHFDRAEAVLNQADEAAVPKEDQARFHTLRGLALLHRSAFKEAGTALERALSLEGVEKPAYLYLAQARYGTGDYPAALKALDRGGAELLEMPGTFLVRAQCRWKLGEAEAAWSSLDEGETRFPDDARFVRRKLFLLVELGLFQEAVELGERFFTHYVVKEADFLAFGEALRKNRQYEKALAFLENARLRFPENETFPLLLSNLYRETGNLRFSARLMEEAAYRNPKYVQEAAERYRAAGDLRKALYHNARIENQKDKIRQRLAILLQMGRYEMASAMAGRIRRLGLLDNEDIRYALAYAHYQVGRRREAEAHLKKLTRSDLFRKAAMLRKAMESENDGRHE